MKKQILTNAAIIAVVAALAVLLIALLSGVLDDGQRRSSTPAPAVTATPMSSQERCVVAVMGYLAQVPDALAKGYDGVDPSELIAQYGTESPEYRTFVVAQGMLITDISQHGSAGSLARIQPWVRKGCREGGL